MLQIYACLEIDVTGLCWMPPCDPLHDLTTSSHNFANQYVSNTPTSHHLSGYHPSTMATSWSKNMYTSSPGTQHVYTCSSTSSNQSFNPTLFPPSYSQIHASTHPYLRQQTPTAHISTPSSLTHTVPSSWPYSSVDTPFSTNTGVQQSPHHSTCSETWLPPVNLPALRSNGFTFPELDISRSFSASPVLQIQSQQLSPPFTLQPLPPPPAASVPHQSIDVSVPQQQPAPVRSFTLPPPAVPNPPAPAPTPPLSFTPQQSSPVCSPQPQPSPRTTSLRRQPISQCANEAGESDGPHLWADRNLHHAVIPPHSKPMKGNLTLKGKASRLCH